MRPSCFLRSQAGSRQITKPRICTIKRCEPLALPFGITVIVADAKSVFVKKRWPRIDSTAIRVSQLRLYNHVPLLALVVDWSRWKRRALSHLSR